MRELSPLFDTDSVRRYEAAAIAAAGDDSVLMERAGQAAWQCVLARWPAATKLLVVCGRGGNGGDGYVLARLAQASGRAVEVVEDASRANGNAAAKAARTRYVDSGGRITCWSGTLPPAEVVVDALLGIGLDGVPREAAAALIRAINAQGAPVLSLDVPSGVDATGVPAEAVRAACTLEFLLPKATLRTGPALECAGEVDLASLGVAESVQRPAPSARVADVEALVHWLQPRRRDSHKGDHGRVACIGGDHAMGGAIALCAEAALRAGAGLVRVHTRDAHHAGLLARLPEAMLPPESMGLDLDWPDAVVLGPGLGQGNWGFAWLHQALDHGRAFIIDADALNLVARHALPLPPGSILTPHPGEAARLLRCPVAQVQRDRFDAARQLAMRYCGVVVLKGAGTVIAAPDRTPVVLAAGNPGMATGGMGDVLAGVIAALRAQGLDAFEAACAGALLHSAAGDAAAAKGERGLLPSDLMPHLRRLANPA